MLGYVKICQNPCGILHFATKGGADRTKEIGDAASDDQGLWATTRLIITAQSCFPYQEWLIDLSSAEYWFVQQQITVPESTG